MTENHPRRVGVTITKEQHELLAELSRLQKGTTIAGFLRQQLDASTPLLRSAVPLLRRAAQEQELSVKQAAKLLHEPLRLMREMGMQEQLDLLDAELSAADNERNAASGSERGREAEAAGGRDGA